MVKEVQQCVLPTGFPAIEKKNRWSYISKMVG